MPPFSLDRRFTLVTGKGGVGKSTVCALLALRSARAGHRTLVCELNTQERISGLLGHERVGGVITELEPNLHAVDIQPALAMEEYALMKLRFRALYKLLFENPVMQSLVHFVPGMNDLVMMGKAFHHERERRPDGGPVWDRIIIDAPATGHGLTFFRLPRIIRDAVPAGNMHQEAADMWDLLTDPARSVVHLVSLPEELPARETLELCAHLREELEMPLGHLFVNGVPPPLFDPVAAAAFAQLTERPQDPRLGLLWDTTRIRLGREALAQRYLGKLAALGLPTFNLPVCYSKSFGRPELESLLEHLPT